MTALMIGNSPSPFREDGTQFAWDSTSLGWAQTCLKYYQYKMYQRWQSKLPNVHLKFGGHYARALEKFYKFKAEGMSHDDALIEVLLLTLRETWDYAYNEDGTIKTNSAGGKIGAPWMSGEAKNRENLIRTIIWYCDTFKDDMVGTVILPNGKPAVEYSFRLEIDHGNFYSGHIDRLCDYGGAYYIMDQKTTGHTISSSYFNQFDLDVQMTGYIFAGQAIWEAPVKGVIIDGAQIAVGFSRFERGYTFRTPDQLDEWYEDTLYFIERAQEAARNQYFPRDRTACNKFNGCEFRRVCSRPKALRENVLQGDFYQRAQWNPLEER